MISQRLMKPAALAFILALAAAPARSENVENCERGFEASDAGNNAGAIVYYSQCLETGVNGGAIMHHARRPDYPVAAAQKCAIYGPLLAVTGGGRCTAWSFMQRFGWRLSKRD